MLVSGLLSGIDWEHTVNQLMQLERRPLQQLQSRRAQAESLKSTWSEIKNLVAAVRDAVQELQRADLLQRHQVKSSHPDAVTAAVDGSVLPGTYDVTVERLARAHSVASDQFTGAVGLAGTFTLSGDGGSTWVTIDVASGDTLAQIAAKINDAYEAARHADPGFVGVKATVIDHRLVLTRSATGSQSITVGGDTELLQGLGILDAGGAAFANELRAGADAQLTINGLTVTSASNQVTAVQGLTIELFEADPGRTITLTVERDQEAVESKIQGFVTVYNQMVQALGNQTARGGRLQGDTTATSLVSFLRARIGGSFNVDGRALSLSAIGIRTDGTSPTLTFDAKAFWDAYGEDPSAVQDLLATAGAEVEAFLTGYTEANGIIDTRTKGLDARIKVMQDSIDRWEVRLEMRRANLMRQYQAMEALIAQMSAQGNWLALQTQGLLGSSRHG